MCNNQCLKQWPRPVSVFDREPSDDDGDCYGRVLVWSFDCWISAYYYEAYKYDYWMRLPPNPEV